MKCLQIIVSGTVQGVFFRANTSQKAADFGLKGYAKNLLDGTVEIVAEGDEEKINKLIEFIRSNPGASKVTNLDIKNIDLQSFKNFEIIH